ncbi:MAG: hypothetical protein EBV77_13820, partial [Gemmatimonadaceae bacterium]|nr:hypothetical protein [Gemmatimonadaceae bacterium]
MSPPSALMIMGSSAPAVDMLAELLRDQPAWRASSLVTTSAHPITEALATLPGLQTPVRVLVIVCSDDDLGNLEALALMDPALRPPVIVCGSLESPEANRAALRAGALDLLPAAPAKA